MIDANDLSSTVVCGVCGHVLDRIATPLGFQFIHGREADRKDHIAVPVEYSADTVIARCDVCDFNTPPANTWTLPMKDFLLVDARSGIPIFHSSGAWCLCPECKDAYLTGDVEELIDRHWVHKPGDRNADKEEFFRPIFAGLHTNALGPPHPYRLGDENT